MWPPWLRSPGRPLLPAPAPAPAPARNYSISTFKDVQSLVSDNEEEKKAATLHPPRSAASVFRRVCSAAAALRSWSSLPSAFVPPPPEAEDAATAAPAEDASSPEKGRIVVYYTSLRVVRRTFEDGRAVRAILRGLRLAVDERDVSMERRFAAEAAAWGPLPQVVIGGRWFGGAEEIRRLNESGELRRMVAGFPRVAAGVGPCVGCGGVRFVLCGSCSGSHKCHLDKGDNSGFRICPSCNENGLVRCPLCCSDD